ncbi:MAG: hypothetical protein B7Z81_14760 [Acidocella sp. 20-61-6]|nr:MAG: hypothetical protein B7Z81_14760 [Acidocella sp. 20-61-6]
MVEANTVGGAGNVQKNSVVVLSSPVSGVDKVTNISALTGGVDAESDEAFKARFTNYLASLSRATDIAIGSTIAAIQQGLSYAIDQNINQAGGVQMGNFVVTVDDGSGSPSEHLLEAVQQAVGVIRPVGTSFVVQAPVVSYAEVAVTLLTTAGSSHNMAVAAVATAIEAYIAALPVGGTLSYARLAQLSFDASGAVNNLSGLLLNGGTTDLVPPFFGVVRVGTVTVA